MKKIETRADLESWIKKCNSPLKTKDVVELQDEFAHTDVRIMHELFKVLNDKKPFLWSVQKVMGMDTFFEYVRIYIRKSVDDELEKNVENILEKENQLARQRSIFEDCKKPIHKKIRELKEKVESKDKLIKGLIQQNRNLLDFNKDLHIEIEEQNKKNNDLVILRNFAHLISRMGEKE